MNAEYVRKLAALLGVGSIVFGVAPALAPRVFGRLAGIASVDSEPSVVSVIRSVGIRDAIIGLGLWSAAVHGGNYAPWLLARALADTGDTIGVAVAITGGEQSRRFLALGGVALSAAMSGVWLYREARRTARIGALTPDPACAI